MGKKNKSLLRLLRSSYRKLFKTDDSAQRVAAGFGIGVFLGFLPGTGPLAALCAAFLLKLNRAGALLGSLLVNTWTSIVTFLVAIKIGSAIMGQNWQDIYNRITFVFNDFRFHRLFEISFGKIILPVIIGYSIIAIGFGITAYILMLTVSTLLRLRHKQERGKDA